MATTAAIQAITEATVRVLKEAPRPTSWTKFQVAPIRGQDYQTPPAELPADGLGVSIYLWRVGPNAAMRNRRQPPAADGTRFRPPVALDLLYLMSAWGKTAVDQHAVLGWAIRSLMDVGTLPRGLLNSGTAVPAGEVFGPGETAELTWETLPTEFAGPLSDLLKPNWPPTVVVVARGVLIDSTVQETPDGPPVQARSMVPQPWSGNREDLP